MNYVYDITLNFNKDLYSFYEWNKEDRINLFLKIPIFKVEDKIIKDMFLSTIALNVDFINKIKNKTEIYNKKNKDNSYAIFASDNKVIALMFNDKGISIKKSSLCIDEEDDILEFVKLIKYSLIDYKIIEKKSIKNKFITRNENDSKNKLLNEIKTIYKNKEYDKLKYIFYELYDEINDNNDIIYNKIINIIENNSKKINKIDYIFNTIKS